MNRVTAKPGSSLPVEEMEFLNTFVKSLLLRKTVTQAGELKQHYNSKSYPPKQFNVFETHAHPTPILIILPTPPPTPSPLAINNVGPSK